MVKIKKELARVVTASSSLAQASEKEELARGAICGNENPLFMKYFNYNL
jgi:hypothetical protein|tara:strand:+ start:613 stop:759 length:147 start_codon:yes stop_codon:yes gene_type:complete